MYYIIFFTILTTFFQVHGEYGNSTYWNKKFDIKKIPESLRVDIDVKPISGEDTYDEKFYTMDLYRGHHHHAVLMKNIKEKQKVSLYQKRGVFGSDEFIECGTGASEEFFTQKELYNQDYPVFYIPSSGFLPGEEIEFLITAEPSMQKGIIKLTPNPVAVKSQIDDATVTFHLTSAFPLTMYRMETNHFNNGEIVHVKSKSYDEIIEHPMLAGDPCLFTLGVIGKKGGYNEITVTRRNKEELKVNIPWGTELEKHASGTEKPLISKITDGSMDIQIN